MLSVVECQVNIYTFIYDIIIDIQSAGATAGAYACMLCFPSINIANLSFDVVVVVANDVSIMFVYGNKILLVVSEFDDWMCEVQAKKTPV